MHENIYISTTYIIMRPSCVCVWGGVLSCVDPEGGCGEVENHKLYGFL